MHALCRRLAARPLLLRWWLALVILAGAIGPSGLQALSVAQSARWLGACLPSQGVQAAAVRQGQLPRSQDHAGHHCAACSIHLVAEALLPPAPGMHLHTALRFAPARAPMWTSASPAPLRRLPVRGPPESA